MMGLHDMRIEETASERIILFTRYPEPGRVKTRMIPALDAEGSARLHRRLTELVLARILEFAASGTVTVEIRYSGGTATLMEEWLGSDLVFRHCQEFCPFSMSSPFVPLQVWRGNRGTNSWQTQYREQAGDDLGQRMSSAMNDAFAEGSRHVLLVGSDVPGLSPEILRHGMRALQSSDVVLGPATDGGYYLIGLKQPCPEIFAGPAWGSETVLKQTVRIAQSRGLTTTLLPSLDDVDRPEDLPAAAFLLEDSTDSRYGYLDAPDQSG